MAIRQLSYADLQALSSGRDFHFRSTEDVKSLREIIGQDRAVRALEFGLSIRSAGYNIYVAGYPGTGRRHVITRFLAERTPTEPSPCDWCYVHNFDEPDRPIALQLGGGLGPQFASDVERMVAEIRHAIRRAFDSETYTDRKKEIAGEFREKQEKLQKEVSERLRRKGFGIQQTPLGVGIVPLSEKGEPMSRKEFEALPAEKQQAIQAMQEPVQEDMDTMTRTLRQLEAEVRQRMAELDSAVTRTLAEERLKELCEKYHRFEKVCTFLRNMLEDIVRNVDLFKDGGDAGDERPANPLAALGAPQKETSLQRYTVNVLVTNDPQAGAPVVYEANPTHPNIFGRIERRYTMGALVTDFTMLKAGALHRANGGYLVLSALDVLMRPGSWDALKRAIESQEIVLEDLGQALGYAYTETLRPEPIPMRAKIILYGNPMIYQLLFSMDEDFRNLFKVKAEFGGDMDRTDRSLSQLAAFISRQVREHQLLHFDPAAVAEVANFASRLIEDRDKVSTQFTRITDVLCESNHWARQAKAKTVGAEHVRRTIDEKVYRSNLIEERLRESIDRGTLLIETRGRRVGQINGLVVYQLGDYEFGLPSRVTANVHLGSAGVVHIERRADMSGPIHTKGVEILAGLLGERFCQDRPLTLTASLTFEQSYGGVEGDSASAAEYFALISALAEAPIDQSIAVTGSINQKGGLQPIGGATRKVEGFFDVCKLRGLTGKQGVMLPASNVKNLVLRPDVVEAVRKKKFHLWAAETVDDGLELLTGIPAGKRSKAGHWTEKSIGARVDARLQHFAEQSKAFGGGSEKKNGKNGKNGKK
jgi:predicted ATP-dependent protease